LENKTGKLALAFMGVISLLAYLWNLGLNDIWNPNEGFYADSVREMLEGGNYLEISYNYEPRYNKPPFYYWLIALSCKLFGLSEWAIRLPGVLTGLGSVFFTYKIGAFLKGREFGLWSAIVMMFSFQFAINARYASPEVTLTFLITLTLYLFVVGYHRRSNAYLLGAYLALAMTLLTKSYPYLVIIGLIIGVYLWFEMRFRLKPLLRQARYLGLWWGLPLAVVLGLGWSVYMIYVHGDAYYQVFMDETHRRAFTQESRFQPFYYIEANLWGFLPYSFTFYLGLVWWAVKKFQGFWEERVLRFSVAWFVVMLVVFTAAKGKIPTYFMQGHPAMSLLTAYFITAFLGKTDAWGKTFQATYILPGIAFSILAGGVVYFFDGSPILYLLALLPVVAWVLGLKKNIGFLQSESFPFTSLGMAYFLFYVVVAPAIEGIYRQHREIGQVVLREVPDTSIPLLTQDIWVHSLPYYTHRRVEKELPIDKIMELAFKSAPFLALVREVDAVAIPGARVLWTGLLYNGSETRTLEFIRHVVKYREGKESRFVKYALLYRPAE
jgi:4-amino-4-deoxy-L-arabinose transferase-like glycosyltransferase